MGRNIAVTGLVALAIAAVLTSADAGLITHPAAMAGWSGVVGFDSSLAPGFLVADVEYAVFAPGDYTGDDPSGGAEYVYAYQIFGTGGGQTYVSWFSVGLDGDESPADVGSDSTEPVLGGQAPVAASFQGTPITTALWEFIPNTLNVHQGAYSEVLLFTSPYGPEWDEASVSGGYGLQDMKSLPSPVPEPATLALAGLAGAALAALRRR